MSLLLNMLSRLVIIFLPRNKRLLISWVTGVQTCALPIYTTFMAESEKQLKSLLMKVKVESEKVGLKPHIQRTNRSEERRVGKEC